MAIVGSHLRSLASTALGSWLGHPDDLEGKRKQTLSLQSGKWMREAIIFGNKIFLYVCYIMTFINPVHPPPPPVHVCGYMQVFMPMQVCVEVRGHLQVPLSFPTLLFQMGSVTESGAYFSY